MVINCDLLDCGSGVTGDVRNERVHCRNRPQAGRTSRNNNSPGSRETAEAWGRTVGGEVSGSGCITASSRFFSSSRCSGLPVTRLALDDQVTPRGQFMVAQDDRAREYLLGFADTDR